MTKRTDTCEQQPQSKPVIGKPVAASTAQVADRVAGPAEHSLRAFARLLARQVAAAAARGNAATPSTTETGRMP
jgi:hypothetical protein